MLLKYVDALIPFAAGIFFLLFPQTLNKRDLRLPENAKLAKQLRNVGWMLLVASVFIFISAMMSSQKTRPTNQPTVVLNDEVLSKILKVGMSESDVLAVLGPPGAKTSPNDNIVMWAYILDDKYIDRNSKFAVSGFDVRFEDHKVIRWDLSHASFGN